MRIRGLSNKGLYVRRECRGFPNDPEDLPVHVGEGGSVATREEFLA